VLTKLRVRFAREQGQTMAEYAVVMGVITIASVAVFAALSTSVRAVILNVLPLI
jgi:Flp pilus assembly pilin Flp